MRIEIAERLHPFSHCPGISCLLPGSALCLQVFPALLRLSDHSSGRPKSLGEVTLGVKGPVRDFTVVQDLERGEVRIFGQSQEGYFRYKCASLNGERMALQVVKGSVPLLSSCEAVELKPVTPSCFTVERLSLGNHKAQNWSEMRRRQNLEELLPLWFYLGQLAPRSDAHVVYRGTASLLEECRALIAKRDKEKLTPAFLKLWLAGFGGLFVPRLEDEQHQGFDLPPASETTSPLLLLTEGAQIIRSLFIQQCENWIALLPALPPAFHCGRMVGVHCPPYGSLDLEWSKKQLRRLVVRADCDGEVQFCFQPDLKEFRLRDSAGSSAKVACGAPLSFAKGREYLLDNFRR